MTKDEALRMALDALEADPLEMVADVDGHMVFLKDKAITAIKKSLAQTQDPVAWGVFEGNLHDMFFSPSEAQEMADLKGTHAEVRPLYTAPQRTWVGLTAKEKHEFRYSHMTTADFIEVIEAKLKEKNLREQE